MKELGPGWTGQVTDTPRPATASGDAEYYAIIWRSSTLRPCAGWSGLRYFVDNDGGPSGKGPDNFSREPAFGCYAYGPADKPAKGDFILAAYPARPPPQTEFPGGDTDAFCADPPSPES